jgi:cytidylate kinase
MARKAKQERRRSGRVITISRVFGAGGVSVTRILGKALGWPVWDREILDVLADQSQGQFQSRMYEALDEKAQGTIDSFLSSLSGKAGRKSYFYNLPRAVYIIAQSDAIILGRGANHMLPNALSVFLKASMETRLKNAMQLLNVSEKEARREIEKLEREKVEFLREMKGKFRKKGKDPYLKLDYDIEINTDRVNFQEAANLILAAASTRFGMPVWKA